MKTRMNALLAQAAKDLEKGIDPFSTEWLSENDVKLEEAMGLSEKIGTILKGYLASDHGDQVRILALGAAAGTKGIDMKVFRATFELHQTRKKLLGELKK
jgi:hypothetical protein